jgi:hypothetical protein
LFADYINVPLKQNLMDESTLLKIALLTSIVGIIALLAILGLSDISESTISQVKTMDDGAGALVSGTVERITVKGNFSIIVISKKEQVSVVAFENISIKKGDEITVLGQVKEYKGEKELVADKITVNS